MWGFQSQAKEKSHTPGSQIQGSFSAGINEHNSVQVHGMEPIYTSTQSDPHPDSFYIETMTTILTLSRTYLLPTWRQARIPTDLANKVIVALTMTAKVDGAWLDVNIH